MNPFKGDSAEESLYQLAGTGRQSFRLAWDGESGRGRPLYVIELTFA
jgi:hypothetical protein